MCKREVGKRGRCFVRASRSDQWFDGGRVEEKDDDDDDDDERFEYRNWGWAKERRVRSVKRVVVNGLWIDMLLPLLMPSSSASHESGVVSFCAMLLVLYF